MSRHTRRDNTDDAPLANEGRPGWTAHIECAGDAAAVDERFDDQLVDLMLSLDDCGGSVCGGLGHDHYGASFSVYTDSDSPTEVLDQAIAIFLTAVTKADLPPWPIVQCEVFTFVEHDHQLDA